MNPTSPAKNPWFGPKTYGFGVRPRTWQGWLSIAFFLVIESIITPIAEHLHPSWYKAKVFGYGWDPATWQSWILPFCPVAFFLIFVIYMYFKQRKT